MNDVQALDDATMKLGLLMESAKTHQELAETQLARLHTHTRDLDGVVRDEIRRTLVDELQALTLETAQATRALERVRRSATLRSTGMSVVVAVFAAAIPVVSGHWLLPSEDEIARLRERRDTLTANLEQLEQRGAKIEFRHCGQTSRLCVRIDRKSPTYGDHADFYVAAVTDDAPDALFVFG